MHEEAIRLRREQRKSLREIQVATGVSKGTLSLWLRPYPLTSDEVETRMRERRRPGPPRKPRGEKSRHHRALAGRQLTSEEKGRIAEAAVLFRLALRNFTVFRSAFDGGKVDFLVQPPGTRGLLRLQVRWVKQGCRS